VGPRWEWAETEGQRPRGDVALPSLVEGGDSEMEAPRLYNRAWAETGGRATKGLGPMSVLDGAALAR